MFHESAQCTFYFIETNIETVLSWHFQCYQQFFGTCSLCLSSSPILLSVSELQTLDSEEVLHFANQSKINLQRRIILLAKVALRFGESITFQSERLLEYGIVHHFVEALTRFYILKNGDFLLIDADVKGMAVDGNDDKKSEKDHNEF